ncbi:Oidioi.mRNA.OKI2018_I69.XSR.g16698.t1.cds [Oikopleura dioica]|uniref:Oidioi.mRNA.OKI2018_I69.XSR.g16698.t1.cds n=1 Tax=Oikopleura dioica TaxID=34765 RepID=A0ABN7SHG1_OIKDI|nr:Oidioi.mRNA.OKI2018_I69.XSR.g16698.t1.cds [Oikopleura dioica]
MGDDGTGSWVNPAAVIKRKRKKTTRASIASKTSTEEKENLPKKPLKTFNPFAKLKEQTNDPANTSLGLSSLTVDSQTDDSQKDEKANARDNEFLSALENHGNVTDLPNIEDRFKFENILNGSNGRSLRNRRRTIANMRDLDDDSARDGFTAQNNLNQTCSIPLDFSIKSKMKIKFSDTSALRRIKKEDWNTAISVTPADPTKLSQKLAAACLYYAWPATIGKKFYPRYATDFEPSSHGQRAEYWTQFEETIDAAFDALKTKFLPLFYVFTRSYSIVFYTHDGSSNPNNEDSQSQSALSQSSFHSKAVPSFCIRAVIAPATQGLKNKLIKEGVKESPKKEGDNEEDADACSPKPKFHRSNSCSGSSYRSRALPDPDFDFNPDDDESWDALRAMNVIKMKSTTAYDTKYHDGKGKTSLSDILNNRMSFRLRRFNFLVDLKSRPEWSSPNHHLFRPFRQFHGQKLDVKSGAEQINIEGILLPVHQYEIHKVLHELMQKRTIREYEVEYFTDKPTKSLSNYVPGRSLENSSDENVKDFLSSKPQSLRQLKWKDDIFNIV